MSGGDEDWSKWESDVGCERQDTESGWCECRCCTCILVGTEVAMSGVEE